MTNGNGSLFPRCFWYDFTPMMTGVVNWAGNRGGGKVSGERDSLKIGRDQGEPWDWRDKPVLSIRCIATWSLARNGFRVAHYPRSRFGHIPKAGRQILARFRRSDQTALQGNDHNLRKEESLSCKMWWACHHTVSLFSMVKNPTSRRNAAAPRNNNGSSNTCAL